MLISVWLLTDQTGMRSTLIWRRSTREGFKVLRSFAIIEMQGMDQHDQRRLLALINVCRAFGLCDLGVVVCIFNKLPHREVGNGRSSYARKRRAKSIGRCERCYRVYPPIGVSKCNNRTCKPGISYNEKVANFIWYGVTEVIPHPGFNF
ncbi:nucleic acid-binding protein [Blueberry virus S]|uniref:RNA silencing suppressor n=1 Tax=Blueberry virus S TaxID=2967988 RepID=A0AAE9SQ57_9VIRU|nr:nucleic acid-binding protein [Blueberry virus S]